MVSKNLPFDKKDCFKLMIKFKIHQSFKEFLIYQLDKFQKETLKFNEMKHRNLEIQKKYVNR